MISANNMKDYARDCVRLANGVNDPALRERLLQMAREWMAAAMDEERSGRRQSSFFDRDPNATDSRCP